MVRLERQARESSSCLRCMSAVLSLSADNVFHTVSAELLACRKPEIDLLGKALRYAQEPYLL